MCLPHESEPGERSGCASEIGGGHSLKSQSRLYVRAPDISPFLIVLRFCWVTMSDCATKTSANGSACMAQSLEVVIDLLVTVFGLMVLASRRLPNSVTARAPLEEERP